MSLELLSGFGLVGRTGGRGGLFHLKAAPASPCPGGAQPAVGLWRHMQGAEGRGAVKLLQWVVPHTHAPAVHVYMADLGQVQGC